MKKILLNDKKIFQLMNVKNKEEYENIPFEVSNKICKKYMCYALPFSDSYIVWEKYTSKKIINFFLKDVAYKNLIEDTDLANEILEEILEEEEENFTLLLLYDKIGNNKKRKIKNKIVDRWIKIQEEEFEEVEDLFDNIVDCNETVYLLKE